MTSLATIRERRHQDVLDRLCAGITPLLQNRSGAEVWLFGSLARGDWDGYSDVDLLAIAPTKDQADGLADALLQDCLADDVIALSQERWQALRSGDDPCWCAIGRDAVRLSPR